jgi:NADH-quinone oxidoreductase subunit A
LFFEFANVLVFTLVAVGFVAVNLLIARLLRPRGRDVPGKREIYECGEPTVGPAWVRFDIRFYTIALMFVVFDVEVALLFPWGAVFRDLVEEGLGVVALVEAGAFIAILMVGLAYVWARGDIDWTATAPVDTQRRPDPRSEVTLGEAAPPSAPTPAGGGAGRGHA